MSERSAGKPVRKYLVEHAEASAGLGAALEGEYAEVVVIPAYGEGRCLDRAIDSVPGTDGGPTLCVVVINQREDSAPAVGEANQAAWLRLTRRHGPGRALGGDAVLCPTGCGALAMLRVTLPRGQGVGLARKHGADFALGAWAAGKIGSSWIHCTDADVQLPADYFRPPHGPAAAALHRFRHHAEEPATRAFVRLYDLWLRLHRLGLHWAGSPYAFHTIGSTIAADAGSYAAVRGFPRRNAAEDFYLLNKLAKLGPVAAAPGAPVRITARVSERVPFGTGAAIGRMRRGGPGALPRFYHPRVYLYLEILLEALERGVRERALDTASVLRSLPARGLDPAPMRAALTTLGVDAAVTRLLRSSGDPARRRRAVDGWFDAFRTMKFIHGLREGGVPAVDHEVALRDGGFLLNQSADAVRDDVEVVGDLARAPLPGEGVCG